MAKKCQFPHYNIHQYEYARTYLPSRTMLTGNKMSGFIPLPSWPITLAEHYHMVLTRLTQGNILS